MRVVDPAGRPAIRRVLSAFALLVLTAASASAQLIVDGNLLFNNGNTGTLVGQFLGAPTGTSLTLS